MTDRLYLPTLAELIDRMTIVQLKAIFISEHKPEYEKEIALIMSDIDTILQNDDLASKIDAKTIRAIAVLMLTNRAIWESESKARAGGINSYENLRLSHSVNGVRNTAKNIISELSGERKDYKIDALAADLDPKEFGAWDIFRS